jgi:hypothetical protein
MQHRSLLSTCLLFTSALFLTVSCSNPGANTKPNIDSSSPAPATSNAPAADAKADIRLGFSAAKIRCLYKSIIYLNSLILTMEI